jgi:hypothetical protein
MLLIFRYLHFANLDNANKGVPRAWFVGSVCVRDLILLGLCSLVIRDIWHPEHDVVRRTTGRDDPVGGVLEDAPDVIAGADARRPVAVPV